MKQSIRLAELAQWFRQLACLSLLACGAPHTSPCVVSGTPADVGDVRTILGDFDGYRIQREGLGFTVIGTGTRRWRALYDSPRECQVPTLTSQNPILESALRNYEVSGWRADGCGHEELDIPHFGELRPLLRHIGQFLAQQDLG